MLRGPVTTKALSALTAHLEEAKGPVQNHIQIPQGQRRNDYEVNTMQKLQNDPMYNKNDSGMQCGGRLMFWRGCGKTAGKQDRCRKCLKLLNGTALAPKNHLTGDFIHVIIKHQVASITRKLTNSSKSDVCFESQRAWTSEQSIPTACHSLSAIVLSFTGTIFIYDILESIRGTSLEADIHLALIFLSQALPSERCFKARLKTASK
ncbi:UNVERIFIED_CONTAM: hypothetical protein K2H54_022398 [Gekko kuhli]